MSMPRIPVVHATILAVLVLASQAAAQHEIHHVPPAISFDGYNPDLLHPFIEPLTFDHDWQFFKQADPEIFGNPIANTGWFATYSRVYLWVTRPENQSATSQSGLPITVADSTDGDFTWGNRFDLGYMTEEDHGWFVSFLDIDGPNTADVLQTERINVFEAQDEINSDPTTVIQLRGGGGGGGGQQQMNQMRQGVPDRDLNNAVTGQRDYLLTNTINQADLTSFEFNKSFRLHRLHHGSVVEPFIGFRYGKFVDTWQRDAYLRLDRTGLIIIPPTAPPPDPAAGIVERLTSRHSEFINYLVGGQLGLRVFHEKGRWDLATEVRAFALQNFQSLRSVTDIETTVYTGTTLPADPTDLGVQTVLLDRLEDADHAAEIVFGTEVRAEAAYEITRDVALNLGMQFLYFGRGIGRGNDIHQNDQNVIMVGSTMGFIVNR